MWVTRTWADIHVEPVEGGAALQAVAQAASTIQGQKMHLLKSARTISPFGSVLYLCVMITLSSVTCSHFHKHDTSVLSFKCYFVPCSPSSVHSSLYLCCFTIFGFSPVLLLLLFVVSIYQILWLVSPLTLASKPSVFAHSLEILE